MENIMTDTKLNKPKTSDKTNTEEKSEQGFSTSISMTSPSEVSSGHENKQPKKNKTTSTANEKKTTMKTPETMPPTLAKDNSNTNKQKLSKTAVLSLIIALAASSGVGGLFYWNMQQQAVTKQAILQQTQQSLASSELQVKQLLDQQKATFSAQLTKDIAKISRDSQIKISQLEKVVERLSQNQPSDWLLHEAEYLIRIATRTVWLEHDTRSAIGLLQDADMRLKELKSPEVLPIRQLIRDDIELLRLMPQIDNEDTILTLMALNKQLKNLPVKLELIPKNFVTQVELNLSEDISDWKENIAKTWQYFSDSFITIKKRDGKEEPLLSPQYQQNLRENLSLKLQLVQWSASEQKQKLYNQNLDDIQLWLEQYFDMTAVENKNFYQSIKKLKSEMVSYDYPSTLSSLNAIRKALEDKPLKPMIENLQQETHTEEPTVDEAQMELNEKLKSSSEAV